MKGLHIICFIFGNEKNVVLYFYTYWPGLAAPIHTHKQTPAQTLQKTNPTNPTGPTLPSIEPTGGGGNRSAGLHWRRLRQVSDDGILKSFN